MTTQIVSPNIMRRAFPGILEKESEEMIAAGSVCTYPVDYILCTEGAIESTFYIILDGSVEVTKLMTEQKSRVMKRLGKGDFFGEMALIHNAPRTATVTTLSSVKVLEIRKDDFNRLLESSSSVSLAMVKEVSRRLRENDTLAIEELRYKAAELATAYQQLAEMENARSSFLTTIAHELRTPLTSANGFVQIIRKGLLQGDALDAALNTIAENLQEIISLTNDILFMQEMELILPDFQPVHIDSLLLSAVEQLKSKAQEKGCDLQLDIVPDLPMVMGDSKSLERALTAVMGNAIKFSPEGGIIELVVRVVDDQVSILVQDHGVGIPPDALPKIFDRFFHLDEIQGYLFRGAGLGLSIARQVIEQHGGRIHVESELGAGSAFTIWLKVTR